MTILTILEPGMLVMIEFFSIISSTAGVVSWEPLDQIHHNDETVNYTIVVTNLNRSLDIPAQTLHTAETVYTLTGTSPFLQC